MNRFWIMIVVLLFSAQSSATEGWIIATQNELLKLDEAISIEVIKPNAEEAWPDQLSLTIFTQVTSEVITLEAAEEQGSQTRRHYTGKVKSAFNGEVLVKLTNQPSNRLLMTANPIDVASHQAVTSQQEQPVQQVATSTKKEPETIVIPEPKEERTISVNEPLYFIVGSNKERDFDARFQISFKYRPFDPGATVAEIIPYASNLYFAYTQTGIWDLGSESSPFKDTSYRPSVYYNWDEKGEGYNPDNWKFGLEHESNGRDGIDSRSLNIAFVQPTWNLDFSGGKTFTFMPRFYYYLDKAENRDLHHYRGYVDWIVKYGRDDAAIISAMYRQGTDGYAQGQLDFSYPISDKIFGRTGTFLHFQLLGGYGETLIDYNKRSDTQLRVGISLTR